MQVIFLASDINVGGVDYSAKSKVQKLIHVNFGRFFDFFNLSYRPDHVELIGLSTINGVLQILLLDSWDFELCISYKNVGFSSQKIFWTYIVPKPTEALILLRFF